MDVIKKADISLFGIDDEKKNDSSSIYTTKIKSSKYPPVTYKSTTVTDDNIIEIMETLPISSLVNGESYNISKNDKYVIFKSSGSITLKESLNCDILVVGGGGGGGSGHGGGGGAGALIYKTNYKLNSGSYTVTIGGGGAGGAAGGAAGDGTNGGDTTITNGAITIFRAKGGGKGVRVGTGGVGGSGGGAGGSGGGVSTISNDNIPQDTDVFGFAGGSSTGSYIDSGGGGGAGGVGANGSGNNAGNGGSGKQISITGTPIFYAAGGGGGGSTPNGIGGTGGAGGGGTGGSTGNNGSSAIANTGSGGGGSGFNDAVPIIGAAGAGGSGVVIIRFKTTDVTSSSTLVSGIFNYETIANLHYANNTNLLVDFDTGKIDMKTLPTITNTDYVELYKKPLVWYKFDDSTASLINDSSGNNYTLTNTGVTFDNTNYKRGNGSSSYIGTTNYLSVPTTIDFNAINAANGITFSCWIKINSSTPSYAAVFHFGTVNGAGNDDCRVVGFNRFTANDLRFFIVDVPTDGVATGKTGFGQILNDVNYADGTWRFVTWTISATGYVNIYINGVNKYAGQWMVIPQFTVNKRNRIGSLIQSNTSINGNIDDFRIYDYALTPEEVNILYNNRYIDTSYPLLKDFTSRQYPPKLYNSMTSEINTTLNGQNCKRKDLILNTTGITYGSGTYELYLISNSDDYLHSTFKLFDHDLTLNGAGGHFGSSFSGGFYGATGSDAYSGTNYLVSSSYKGEWCVIKMPVPIILSSYKFIQRTGFEGVSPKDFILYGSMDGTNWTIIQIVVGATYTSQIFTSTLSTNASFFTYYGIVVNKLIGGMGISNVVNFIEWQLFGREDNEITTLNPVAWYKFDDGNLTTDSSGNSFTLTNSGVTNNLTNYIKGNGSAEFNGTNYYSSTNATLASYFQQKSFSVSFWLYPKTNNIGFTFSVGANAAGRFWFGYGTQAQGVYEFSFVTANLATAAYTDANTWVYITYTYNITTGLKSIYRNGVLIGSQVEAALALTDNTIYIGRIINTSSYAHNCIIDDFRIYNRTLSLTEVQELYRGRVQILTTATNKTFYNQTNPYLLLNNTIDNVNYLLTTKPSTFEKKNTKRYLFNIDRNIKQLKLTDRAKLAIKSITIPTVISKSYLQSKAINNVIIKMIPIPMDRYISDSSQSSGNPILFSIPLKTNSQGFGVTYSGTDKPDLVATAQRPRLNTDNNGYLFINPNPDYLYNFSINQSFLDNGYFEFEVIYDIGEVFQLTSTLNTYNFIQETLDYNTDRDNLEGFNINFIITDVDDTGEKVYNEMSLLNKTNRTEILNP